MAGIQFSILLLPLAAVLAVTSPQHQMDLLVVPVVVAVQILLLEQAALEHQAKVMLAGQAYKPIGRVVVVEAQVLLGPTAQLIPEALAARELQTVSVAQASHTLVAVAAQEIVGLLLAGLVAAVLAVVIPHQHQQLLEQQAQAVVVVAQGITAMAHKAAPVS
jgi:hypothetical protein